MAFDFPDAPLVGQIWTASTGKYYTWDGVAWLTGSSGSAGTPGDYVLKAGDTMTGFLTLNADPLNALHAATKQYVDNLASGLPTGGVAGEALVKDPANAPAWGAAIDAGNY